MKNQNLRRSASAVAILTALGALVGSQIAVAGPGISPVYSANAAPPPAAPDTFANTYYANSPLGLRTDLVANPLNPTAPGTIDTGTALRKFVDILPGIHSLAPTTNIGTGTTGTSPKYIPVAVPTKWPGDNSDYYHLAIVEYTEYLHSDLPKPTVLRGYVQIEEPGQATPAGSKHVQLFYPNGSPMTLPDANGVQQPVYGYDNPHYLGPAISATKDVAVRIKYSNLLPVGDATGQDPWGGTLGNGVANRNGDLPIPVDQTLAGGALQQNRIDVHLHGGLTPWISDGNPHQWTIPVGDNRYSFVSDIAVTATGAGYTAPVVTIDPPQSNATGHAAVSGTKVSALYVDNPGAFYTSAPSVTIAPPTLPPGTQATATAAETGFKVTSVTGTAAGTNYSAVPAVTVSAPTGVPATATATAALGTGAAATHVASIANTSAGALYATAPTVTIAAPPAAVNAAGTATLSGSGVGSIAVNNTNFGYWTAPSVTVSAPRAAVNATGTATLSGQGVGSIAVNNTNFGYFTAPSVTVSAPAAAVAATGAATLTGNGVSAVSVNNTNFGYFTAPSVTLSAPAAAVAATATATLTGGAVSAIAVNNTNFGYFTAPTVTITPPGAGITATATSSVNAATGAVSGLTLGVAGLDYTTAPSVTIAAPPATVQATATSTATGGALSAIAVGNAGFGYWTAPTVTVSAPAGGGTTASATTTVNATTGALNAITVTSSGSGYTAAPTLTIAAPPAAVNATATATVSGGTVASVALSNVGNFGYWAAPRVTLSAPPATVTAAARVTTAKVVTISNGGTGYTTAPTVTVTGGTRTSGTAWTATATVANGVVTGITVSGTGVYSVAPTLTIAAPARATTATATATVANGRITGFTITNPGTGYTTAPTVTVAAATAGTAATVRTVTLTGGVIAVTLRSAGTGYDPLALPALTFSAPAGGGTQATATASVANGVITGYTITNAGSGYTSAPTITVGAPTAGTQATATATVAGGVVTGFTVVGGKGYNPLAAPAVTIGAPTGAGTPATATATIAGGKITGFTISGGSGYTSAPTVTISAPTPSATATAVANINAAGKVTGVTVTSAGANYTAAPTVTYGAPTASVTATATANVANGVITGYTVTNAGTNYTAAPTVTVGAATPSVAATATATVAGGVITGVNVTNAGAGYVSAPTVTIPAATAGVQATATAALTGGAVSGYTITNAGSGYPSAPAVTLSAPPAAATATVTATLSGGSVSGYTITNPGWGYIANPTVTVAAPYVPAAATATAVLASDGTLAALNIVNPGLGYSSAPVVTIAPNPIAQQATATATVTGGSITGVTIGNIGRGYLATPNVTISDAHGTGGAISAMVAQPVGPGFRNVPDMVGHLDASQVPAGYTTPSVGEGTLYYTNNQTERLMWYHDHTSGTTRLNVYEGLAAPFLITDPAVDPQPVGSAVVATGQAPVSALDSYVPREQIPFVIQDKTFVPKDIMQQDGNWDTTHWGQYGDLWFPHVYETNQNPAFLHSLSNLGRWDWGPWFAIVYPALYALPSGKYGDVTLTPESYEDTPVVNGVAYPTVSVEPRAYRFRLLNACNDRFLNLGFYMADTTQPAPFADSLHAAGQNFTEVSQFSPTGPQPASVDATGAVIAATPAGLPNVFAANAVNAALLPWPMDGGAAGPGATHIVPTPDTMGPPIISIGNEGGILPQWVQHDAIPAQYDYNRRSATVLNLSQNNDYTQQCNPECHGLYLGPAERADFVVDFAPYAGRTLILYNDAPAPNPGYDTRIDYYTGNDPTGFLNYETGGAPNTQAGYGPNTRTVLQFTVGTAQNVSGNNPIDYTNALGTPVGGLQTWDPTKLGGGRVLGVLTSNTPGVINQTYSATQPAPIVGESAYNIAFNPTTAAANAAKGLTTSTGGYTDSYGNMYLASQNQPEFYVTNPGPLTITGLALTGNTSATGAASGVGLGGLSSGTNVNAGGGTSYFTPPSVVISPPTACTPGVATCVTATATAQVANGQVTGFTLTNPGAGYTEVPSVLIVSGGSINGMSVTNGGSGYTVAPVVTIAPPDTCSASQLGQAGCVQALATATVNANGVVTGITVTTPGSGYSVSPTVTIAPPPNVAATGTATLAAGAVTGVNVATAGTGYAGVAPAVMFSAAPSGVPAVITPSLVTVAGTTYLTGLTIANAGSGYQVAPSVTLSSGCSATGTTTIDPNTGSVTGVTLTAIGIGSNCSPQDTVVLSSQPVNGTMAAGTATLDPTGDFVTGVTITNPGSGYTAAPTVTFTGGATATALAATAGGGYGAQAVAITSNTKIFIAPAALPGNIVPATSNAVPLTLTSQVASMLGCNAAQTSCTNTSGVVVGRLMNPAIQELFEPFYGRMNATLGVEMPNQSLTVQTTLPLNYIDPATEMWEYNNPVMWKVTHNGVDAHPVHIHLINAQVVNRVGWDGTVKQPEDDEIGWKETIKMNPLEDIILAMLPTEPQTPFGLDRSIRPQDPSQPLGVNMGFTQYSVEGYNGGLNGQTTIGQVMPQQHDAAFFAKGGSAWTGGVLGHSADQAGYISNAVLGAGGAAPVGVGDPQTVVNSLENYDNEYVWHCHILGHEENDFMRPIPVISHPIVPLQPSSVVATQSGAGANVVVSWVDPTPLQPLGTTGNTTFGNLANEMGYLLQRSVDGGNTWTTVATTGANATSATDPGTLLAGTAVVYQVVGYNAQGLGAGGQSASLTVQ